LVGNIFGLRLPAHRVVWAIHRGVWPDGEIDHINGDRADNRISNLRDVTRSENARNAAKPRTNRSGVVGVNWRTSKGKWRAYISEGDRTTHLGYFDDFSEAVNVRIAEERRRGFHENHGRSL
jgi:hypothetical protein